ncbi:MAG: polyphosphate kinase 2 [Campylobacterales bacterium]|nr:polyphosphate kinase 2 [Campylobacterales bacterium]
MNLTDFEITEYTGLYKAVTPHPKFGKKYVARFQLNKKRYVKVLGYDIADNLNDTKAYALLEDYKNDLENSSKPSVSSKKSTRKSKTQTITKKEVANFEDQSLKKLELCDKKVEKLLEENRFMKSILGDYNSIDIGRLQDGIQKIYDSEEMEKYQIELIKLQNHLEQTGKKMIILFEGRDASGKGGAIRRMTRFMNSRHYRVVALGKPSETQKGQWYFQRYIEHFPTGGEVVLFDRSWYNRAMVEPVFGFCTEQQYEIFMEDVVNFEHDLVRQDIILIKLYFSVSKAEQFARFESRRTNPLKQWKLSEVDLQAQDLWDEFSEKKYEMLKRTHSRSAPWHILRSDDKHKARMEAIKVVLNSLDYDDRNYSLNFEPDDAINISVQQELARMRKNRDY